MFAETPESENPKLALLGFTFAISAIVTLKMQGLAASSLPLTQNSLARSQLFSPVAR